MGSLNARDGVELVDLVNGIDISSCPKIDVLADGSANHLIGGGWHDLLQAGIHDIQLSGTLKQLGPVESLLRQSSSLYNHVNQVLLWLLLPLSSHPSGTDVVKIFQPFEVAHSHSSSIAEDVGQELNALLEKNFLCLKSGGSIGSLHDELGLESVSVVNVDGLFQGGWDEEVTK